ncbi:54S ribosomal protein L25, mitochondrial [Vermiconidia calcicola]|uniref:54S ribosomal protein L25, mitochondrial n=1 Tax=Vermiconidia calcicola TaxID=1690605 RepID=A0ACC3MBE3_9PEZI|nr:54S ribosomal protein L25, mitochondrial [Vermiconidia calcicola]
MAAAMETHIRIAKSLDPRLLRFFKRFPPPEIGAFASSPTPQTETIQIASNTSSMDPNAAATTSTETVTSEPEDPRAITNSDGRKRNPFLAFKNPQTGNWHSPHYSLRRQAVLFKLAQEEGVLPLMPLCPKHPEVKEQKRVEQGLSVRGTGVGQAVGANAQESDGGEEEGYGGDAGDGSAVEGTGAWEGVEKVAEVGLTIPG